MKWFVTKRKSGRNGYEHMLYSSSWVRQIWLPPLRIELGRRARGQVLRIPISSDIKFLKWTRKFAPTLEEFEEFRESICRLAPEYAEAIRALPPASRVGHLMLTRTGPSCPDVEQEGGSYVVRESVQQKLEVLGGIAFFPAYFHKIVLLRWKLGEPVPKEFERHHEPEHYIIQGTHSPEVAAQMGRFYELVVPERRWFEIGKEPAEASVVRVAFEGTLPTTDPSRLQEGLVELAIPLSDESPVLYAIPAQDGVYGVYHFVREDIADILRDPGRWTLEFREVKQL